MMKFDVILADPPWDFEVWNRDTGNGRSAAAHYQVMTLDDICRLPIKDLAAENCALFLWSVWPRIFDAQSVIRSWGFEYKTLAWEWVKLNKRWHKLFVPIMPMIDIKWLYKLFFFGMGYYTRANPEPCLLAVKGRMPVAVRSERNLLLSPIRQHSRKPDEQYNKINRLYPNTQRLELFCRFPQPGWAVWGNEINSSIEIAPHPRFLAK